MLALLAVAALAAAGLWLRSRRRRGRRLPQQLPVRPRLVLGRSERQVWLWLRQVFPQHHIMVKLPVTRFTLPRQPEGARKWFGLLGSVYCTFTLCDEQGRVVGCVDVMDERRLSRGNRQLKQTLLSQCRIGYWALTPEAMPEPWTLRAEFLGADATDDAFARASDSAELQTARAHLFEALDRNRSRRSQMAPLEDGAPLRGGITAWEQPSSLPMPLEAEHPAR